MSEPFLDLGDGLEIRSLDPDDAKELFELILAERQRLRPWMPWADTTQSVDDARTFIEHTRVTEDLDGLGIFAEGALVGGIALRVEDSGVDGELGCWVSASREGRWIPARACRAMIGYAFGELGLHRITALVAIGNESSHGLVDWLGFRREGRVREGVRNDDGYHDLVLYGLLEQEWRAG
jgi:ribosomal-protein-serine acetyltransferase